jgi:hypothetical protein
LGRQGLLYCNADMKGFARVDADMRDTKSEIAAVRGEMKAGFERMQRQMLQFYGVLIVAMAGVPFGPWFS